MTLSKELLNIILPYIEKQMGSGRSGGRPTASVGVGEIMTTSLGLNVNEYARGNDGGQVKAGIKMTTTPVPSGGTRVICY